MHGEGRKWGCRVATLVRFRRGVFTRYYVLEGWKNVASNHRRVSALLPGPQWVVAFRLHPGPEQKRGIHFHVTLTECVSGVFQSKVLSVLGLCLRKVADLRALRVRPRKQSGWIRVPVHRLEQLVGLGQRNLLVRKHKRSW